MNSIQILSLCAAAAVVAFTYLPIKSIKIPRLFKSKTALLGQIESLVAIRQSYTDPDVVNACNALLQVLLKVKP